MAISLPIDADANELLSASPLALLIGMLLDQQVTIEKAFTSPARPGARLGHEPTAAELAAFDPDALAAIFSERPALHRYPRAMAGRVQQLCQHIVDRYGGDPAGVWSGAATGAELLARIRELPGFGADKAQIFLALLGKQYGGAAARLARGGRSLRREGRPLLGRRHHRRPVPSRRPRLQAVQKGRRQGSSA